MVFPISNFRPYNNRGRFNLVSLSIAVLLCFYIGIVLPFHHHSDGESHDSCALCIVQHQPVKSTPVFTLPEIISDSIVIVSSVTLFRFSSLVSGYQTRAPPALS
jgi:hypothetical protein